MEKIRSTFYFIFNKPQYFMPAILLLWGAFYFLYGGIINVNNGFGYDGVIYGNLTKNFYEHLFGNQISMYRIQRIFPSFAVDSILRILSLPKKTFYIIKAFQLYNLSLLLICTFIWFKISKIYNLNLKYVWLGFVLGFLNFGIAEFTFYYPVLTDTTAFFLGFCLLYFHLTNNLPGKIIVSIIGAFTWPVLVYAGMLLIIFPVNLKLPGYYTFTESLGFRKFIFPAVLSLPFLITSVWFVNVYFETGVLSEINTEYFDMLLYLCAFLNFLLMTYFLSIIFPFGSSFKKIINFIQNIFKGVKIKNVLISVSLFILIYSIQKYLSNDEISDGGSLWKLFYYISLYSVTKPLSFFVTAVTYSGLCLMFLFFYLKKYMKFVYELGAGVFVSFAISFMLIFSTEVRLITHFFPFIILITVLVLNETGLQKNNFILITVFSFILSKVYIPMFNVPGNPVDMYNFPDQLLFMNIFTVSRTAYVIQGIVILIFSAVLLKSLNSNKINTSS